MQENSRIAVGLDIGTSKVRAVVGQYSAEHPDRPTIIGVGEAANSGGLRKGVVVNLNATAQAIDEALASVERMSGRQIEGANVSINGSHLASSLTRGRISVSGGEIGDAELMRVEDDASAVANVDANHEILDIIPSSYGIDGNENVKDPRGMKGLRLEVDAHVVTALSPNVQNTHKALEIAHVGIHRVIPAGLAAARACLTLQQRESGVVCIDIGASTTSVIVYEEGELAHFGVVPMGGINVTNDLALGLKTDFDVAEKLKLEHAVAGADFRKDGSVNVSVKIDKQLHSFPAVDFDEIVEARIEELFDRVNNELKKIDRHGRLPGGAVLAGDTSNLRGIVDYAKEALGLPARLATFGGAEAVPEGVNSPGYMAALGLMLMDSGNAGPAAAGGKTFKGAGQKAGGLLSGLLKKFKN
jgi:cell division protein FtsA